MSDIQFPGENQEKDSQSSIGKGEDNFGEGIKFSSEEINLVRATGALAQEKKILNAASPEEKKVVIAAGEDAQKKRITLHEDHKSLTPEESTLLQSAGASAQNKRQVPLASEPIKKLVFDPENFLNLIGEIKFWINETEKKLDSFVSGTNLNEDGLIKLTALDIGDALKLNNGKALTDIIQNCFDLIVSLFRIGEPEKEKANGWASFVLRKLVGTYKQIVESEQFGEECLQQLKLLGPTIIYGFQSVRTINNQEKGSLLLWMDEQGILKVYQSAMVSRRHNFTKEVDDLNKKIKDEAGEK